LTVVPPVEPEEGRIPLLASHRQGVTDPMTGSLLRVSGHGDPLVPSSCQRSVAVFDGRMRYDINFSYKRIDHVKA
jgi:hypothetical protein